MSAEGASRANSLPMVHRDDHLIPKARRFPPAVIDAVDTNLLVYAHREDAKFHEEASAALVKLAALNACPTLEFIGETDGYLDSLAGIALAARVHHRHE